MWTPTIDLSISAGIAATQHLFNLVAWFVSIFALLLLFMWSSWKNSKESSMLWILNFINLRTLLSRWFLLPNSIIEKEYPILKMVFMFMEIKRVWSSWKNFKESSTLWMLNFIHLRALLSWWFLLPSSIIRKQSPNIESGLDV